MFTYTAREYRQLQASFETQIQEAYAEKDMLRAEALWAKKAEVTHTMAKDIAKYGETGWRP